jgi:hypothetical protein
MLDQEAVSQLPGIHIIIVILAKTGIYNSLTILDSVSSYACTE